MDELDELAARATAASQVDMPKAVDLMRRVDRIRSRRRASRTGLVVLCLGVLVGLGTVAVSTLGEQDQQVVASGDEIGDGSTAKLGPLATVQESDGPDGALMSGSLRVEDACVFVDAQGNEMLLVWPSDRTGWDAEQDLVLFEAAVGSSMVLRDGDQVTLGGHGTSLTERGQTAAEFLGSVKWASEPETECVTESHWFVDDLVSPDGGETALVVVPEMRGLHGDEASIRLESVGLGVEVVDAGEDHESPPGQVVATDPVAGAQVVPGTTIRVTVVADVD